MAARHILARKKISSTMTQVDEILDAGAGKVVVFSNYTKVLDHAANHCDLLGHGHVRVDGSVTGRKRQDAVERFQSDPKVRVFVGQIEAAGVGITLTAASYVVFNDLALMPATHLQAEDRCLLPNNLVFCPRTVDNAGMALLQIKDIKPGDVVLTHEGNEKEVLATSRTWHEGPVTTIKYVGWNKPLTCTHDHKVLVKRRGENRPEWIMAHQVLSTDSMAFPKLAARNHKRLDSVRIKDEWRLYTNIPKPPESCVVPECNGPIVARLMCSRHYRQMLKTPKAERPPAPPQVNGRYVRLPDEIEIDDDWLYLFGWFVAEGFSSLSPGKSRFVSYAAHEDKRSTLDRIAKVMGRLGIKSTIYTKPTSKGIEMRSYSGELTLWFRDWFGHLAANKSLPTELMHLPPEQARVVLQGYVDGDGYRRNNQQEWVSASRVLCYQMCMLAIRSGFIPTMRGDGQGHWVGCYTFGGKPGRLNDQDEHFVYRPVRRVTTAHRKTEVFDITVEDDHSFATGLAIAHNCHRIGADDTVNAYYMLSEADLDIVLWEALRMKQIEIGSIEREMEASSAGVSPQQLLNLLERYQKDNR